MLTCKTLAHHRLLIVAPPAPQASIVPPPPRRLLIVAPPPRRLLIVAPPQASNSCPPQASNSCPPHRLLIVAPRRLLIVAPFGTCVGLINSALVYLPSKFNGFLTLVEATGYNCSQHLCASYVHDHSRSIFSYSTCMCHIFMIAKLKFSRQLVKTLLFVLFCSTSDNGFLSWGLRSLILLLLLPLGTFKAIRCQTSDFYVCTYVRIHVRTYVCMYVCTQHMCWLQLGALLGSFTEENTKINNRIATCPQLVSS